MNELINTIDWETLGANALYVTGVVGAVILWLRRNIVDLKLLKQDSADMAQQVIYYKALLKDNATIKSTITDQKLVVASLAREAKALKEEIIQMREALKEKTL